MKLFELGSLEFALTSRVICTGLAILSNFFLSDHVPGGAAHFYLDSDSVLSTFTRWDSAHFLYIARHSYTEQQLAFYPLFPFLMDIVSSVLAWIPPSWTREDMLVLSGLLVSNCCFLVSHCLLRRILKKMEMSNALIEAALMFHSLNPASIFMSSVYSESLYMALAWAAILSESRGNILSLFTAVACFFLASCTRSNGSLNLIYLIVGGRISSDILSPTSPRSTSQRIRDIFKLFLLCFAVVSPHIIWDSFGLEVVCWGERRRGGGDISRLFSEQEALLCSSRGQPKLFPTVYSHVQKKYWNVGFLNYFQFKQIPNFLLAAPSFFVAGYSLYAVHSLGLFASYGRLHSDGHISNKNSGGPERRRQALMVGLAVHLGVLMVLGLGWAHIQICTRLFFSGSPLMYWGCGHLYVNGSHEHRRLLVAFAGIYFVVGTILHANFYPWT